jgi:hypothetical protein
MSTQASTTPAWVPTLVSALLTVGATWTTIQTQVPAIVAEQVQAELDLHRVQLAMKADSLWSHTESAIMARVDSATTHAADTVLSRLGFMQATMGQPARYAAPAIIVKPDTALQHRIDQALALFVTDIRQLRQDMEQLKDKPKDKRGRDR